MLTLTEIRASGQVSYQLAGEARAMRQLAEALVASACAQIAAQVRHAGTVPEITVAGKRMAAVVFKPGTSGVPEALIDAALRVGIPLDRSTQEVGAETSVEPEAPSASPLGSLEE